MSQDIALIFRRKFGKIKILKNQHLKIHEIMYIRQKN